ncbi:50S ribosomal protein L24 [Candidatus Woesebacteria bacterium]|nr:50S ribosomal protein L24 [Candidatus Woesebacteria bacterium]
MKFKVGDTVLVTGGKDKGKKSEIVRVLPKLDRVVVKGANMYVHHVKPIQGRPGSKTTAERALPTAKIAVINDKGQQDRIGYTVAKDGSKTRVFKKTGAVMPEPKKTSKE